MVAVQEVKFRDRHRDFGSETGRKRRGSMEELTGIRAVASDGRDKDGGDGDESRFRNGRGGAELVDEVLGLLGLVLGVLEVEEDEREACVCSAELERLHGVAAFSAASPPTPVFFREERGGEKRWRREGGSGGELGHGCGTAGLLLWRGEVARGPDGGGRSCRAVSAFGVEVQEEDVTRRKRGRAAWGAGLRGLALRGS